MGSSRVSGAQVDTNSFGRGHVEFFLRGREVRIVEESRMVDANLVEREEGRIDCGCGSGRVEKQSAHNCRILSELAGNVREPGRRFAFGRMTSLYSTVAHSSSALEVLRALRSGSFIIHNDVITLKI